jgi:hypothetical protein
MLIDATIIRGVLLPATMKADASVEPSEQGNTDVGRERDNAGG